MSKRKLKIYGAGRMGDDPRDEQWREEITEDMEKIGIFWNPYLLEPIQLKGLRPSRLPDKTPDGQEVKHWCDLRHFPKNSAEYKRFQKYMKAIIKYDLELVRKADIIIVRWSKDCKTGGGTHGEVTFGAYLDKPVYCFNESKNIPAWIEGCCTKIFDNMKDLVNFLLKEYEV